MKKRESNKSILFLFLIFIAILFMSIGYGNINDVNLKIEGIAKAEAVKMLVIDNVQIDSSSSSDGGTIGEYNTESTLLQISSLTLPKENVTEDTSVTILVHVKNLSDVAYKFSEIRYLKEEDIKDFPSISVVNSNPNIKIDESSYKDLIGTPIDATSIEGTGTMTIPIKFKYVDITNIEDNTINISIKVNFASIEKKEYKLKTGKNFYSTISSHKSDTTKILFCAKTEVPTDATKIGEAGLTEGEIKAYWNDGTIYIAADTKNSTIIFNEDSGYMFSNGKTSEAFSNVKSIGIGKGIKIDTSNVTQFEEMFKGCSSLTETGLQGFINKFNTEKAVNMCAMFGSMTGLAKLDLSGFSTTNVTDMSWMFEQNANLKSINFGVDFDTSNVKGTKENQGFAGMFQNCSSLVFLDLSSFNTANAGTMWYMFSGCSNLEKIYVSENFVTTGLLVDKVPNSVVFMFKGCSKLKGGGGTTYSSANTSATYAKIDGGTENPGYFSGSSMQTVTLDANGGEFKDGESKKTYTALNTITINKDEKPTKDGKVFVGWDQRKNITNPTYKEGEDITIHDTMTLYAIWQDEKTYALKDGPTIYSIISPYNASAEHIKFTYVENLPEGSTLIGNLDQSDTGEIKGYYSENTKTVYFAAENKYSTIGFNYDSSHMFSNKDNAGDAFRKVKTYDVDDGITIDTGYVQNFAEMFKYNSSVTQESLQAFIDKFDTSSATNMCAMFEYLNFDTIDVSKLDTSNVTDMSWMFHGSGYTKIILGDNFDTSKVKNYDGMFQELPQLEVLDISVIRVQPGSCSDYTFGKCPKLKTIYVSKETKFENSYTGSRMFENDVSLVGGTGENLTPFDSSQVTLDYAKISTADQKGYFTDIDEKN